MKLIQNSLKTVLKRFSCF